jgi:hypothetical protein
LGRESASGVLAAVRARLRNTDEARVLRETGTPGAADRPSLLVINREDLADLVGSHLGRMRSDARDKRGPRPILFTSLRVDQTATAVAAWVRERVDLFRSGELSTTVRADGGMSIITTATATATTTSISPQSGRLTIRVERRDGRTVFTEAAGHVPYAPRFAPALPGWAKLILVQTVLVADCDLEAWVEIELDETVAAFSREVVVLRRHGESAGRYRSRLCLEREGRPLLHDAIELDSEGVAQCSAAILAGANVFASLAVVGIDPAGPCGRDELELAEPGRVLRVPAAGAVSLEAQLTPVEASHRAALGALG